MPEIEVIVLRVYPPIPIRSFDWCAYYEGDWANEDGPRGWGATREEAIEDLKGTTDD